MTKKSVFNSKQICISIEYSIRQFINNNLYAIIFRLDLLMSLIDRGRNIEYLEEEIGPFMLEWIDEIATADRELDFLQVLENLIKYNAAYVDENVLHGFV